MVDRFQWADSGDFGGDEDDEDEEGSEYRPRCSFSLRSLELSFETQGT